MEVEILKYDHLGNGLAKNNEKIVFVKRAMHNEIVNVKIESDKKKYQNAIIENIVKKSDDRIDVICPYYNECGGCDFLHAKYSVEKEFKKEKCLDLIKENPLFYDTCEYNYRNKVTLHVKNNKIGFYEEKTNKIVSIKYCYLLDEKINLIIENIQEYYKNKECLLDEIVIKIANETMLILKGKIDDDFTTKFSFIDNIILNDEVIKGKGYIEKKILDYVFKISPNSFFQVNYQGLECIFNILKDNLKRYNNALDLYSGTSVMGILISSFCRKVISIESNKSSCMDAKENIRRNKINNIEVINDKVENVIDTLKDIDLIIVDPPRKGLDIKTINYINKLCPNDLVYISCNMITLKRDLELLKEKYELDRVSLVNMFPKTYHVECVCILKRRIK